MNDTHPALPFCASTGLGTGAAGQAFFPCPARNLMPYRRSAFTLVELLVVIGIILVLMALLLPAINKSWNTAVRTKMALDLQTISTALEAYRADFQQYPQVFGATQTQSSSAANPGQGAFWLCRALVGPGGMDPTQGGDGAGDSLVIANPVTTPDLSPFGFRVVPKTSGGKIWGPYLAPDSLKMGDPSGGGHMNNYVLMDRYKHPILYYPAKKGSDITQPGGYLGPTGMFNPYDNTGTGSSDLTTGTMPAGMFMVLMGDVNQNGYIDNGESPAFTGNYVLWSAGTDEKFGEINGLATPPAPPSPGNPCDDVNNIPQ